MTTKNFEEHVLHSKIPVIVDFWATWCVPCGPLAEKLEEIAGELREKVRIVTVNVENSPELAQRFRILGMPTMLFFKNGIVESLLPGNHPKETILETLAPLL
ncbi:MAG: thioredoxin family protein [Bdellovibrionota bacterium]